ncbi:MAG: hypothetical protein A2X25_13250 [Chloroflexi bacterium GWB2_49_20]|nr:MAG: hypothetical protein A2X25_13250 [Chloroflexi bacterium GWB2_49_20]OGN80044.1 MAG: hypothetical protein A2X26_03500 [Chloroflexi bacterium GWC2_49_37]OGN85420.1 MAG: hypothetical protein A2X27_03560 [Chloroflexi bacterium GWD2_49_16]HCM97110.1 hypothetical protein [Anaerolineae bacterium]
MKSVNNYRAETFRLNDEARIRNPEQALDYVNQRGFIFFWPVKGAPFPSLWTAVAGDRPVPSVHDDPGHVTWSWKDSALGKHIWYYAKVLRYKATFISLDVLPLFYALSENFGSPDEDYLIAYQEGHLTFAEKLIYEVILNNGPMHTIELRQAARLAGKASESGFNRALEKLQAEFRILPVGVAEAGTWKYAFIYDLTSRHYPYLPDKARLIGEWEARRKLMEYYFLSMGASDKREVQKLFRWNPEIIIKVLEMLRQAGFLAGDFDRYEQQKNYYYLPCLGD